MVCLRNICVNTLHKGDSIFTNNNNNNNNKFFKNIAGGPLTDQNLFPREREKLCERYLPRSSGTANIKSLI
jgi:hypothetical protein